MSRSPTKRPVRPTNAAGLVLLRRHGKQLDVLLGKRRATARFAPGIFVFPGGRCDAQDLRPSGFLEAMPQSRGGLDGQTQRQQTAFARAALRELWEETGYLFGTRGAPETAAAPGLWHAYSQAGLYPAFPELRLIARAITPTESPIRFHTRFFLADGHHCVKIGEGDGELSPSAWFPVEEALTFPLWDVTEFVLRRSIEAFGKTEFQPWRFTYRRERCVIYPKTTRGK